MTGMGDRSGHPALFVAVRYQQSISSGETRAPFAGIDPQDRGPAKQINQAADTVTGDDCD
jgi:hypothetical protein